MIIQQSLNNGRLSTVEFQVITSYLFSFFLYDLNLLLVNIYHSMQPFILINRILCFHLLKAFSCALRVM